MRRFQPADITLLLGPVSFLCRHGVEQLLHCLQVTGQSAPTGSAEPISGFRTAAVQNSANPLRAHRPREGKASGRKSSPLSHKGREE